MLFYSCGVNGAHHFSLDKLLLPTNPSNKLTSKMKVVGFLQNVRDFLIRFLRFAGSRHEMEKIVNQRVYHFIYVLLRRVVKFQVVDIRTAVDLAHKVHGDCGSTKGAPLIVLHGLLGSKRNWESMSKRLSSALNTCAVVVDARNHGQSPHDSSHTYLDLASDVLQLMDTLKLKKATIIGHSMGGRTAMVVALTQPDKIERLVVVDISPVSTAGILNDFFPKLITAMKTVSFDGVKNLSDARKVAQEKMLASGAIRSMEGMNFILMNIAMRADKTIGWVCNLDTLKDSFQTIASFPSEMASMKFNGPTLFVGGEMSNYLPPTDIEGIKSLFPNAELKYVPKVGHNVHAEDPSTFFQMVKDFLSR